ncbi:hypothetical protein ABZS66_46285 [Dactylosporangium sp. NPDC005572]|uniref:hypothetical protein n=1 Tax=Dactylosporangium sp. NPDC005572 TaxID=3156889 RepID=UPI0033A2C993
MPGHRAVALGGRAVVAGHRAVAVGGCAVAAGHRALVVGGRAVVPGRRAVAVGGRGGGDGRCAGLRWGCRGRGGCGVCGVGGAGDAGHGAPEGLEAGCVGVPQDGVPGGGRAGEEDGDHAAAADEVGGVPDDVGQPSHRRAAVRGGGRVALGEGVEQRLQVGAGGEGDGGDGPGQEAYRGGGGRPTARRVGAGELGGGEGPGGGRRQVQVGGAEVAGHGRHDRVRVRRRPSAPPCRSIGRRCGLGPAGESSVAADQPVDDDHRTDPTRIVTPASVTRSSRCRSVLPFLTTARRSAAPRSLPGRRTSGGTGPRLQPLHDHGRL